MNHHILSARAHRPTYETLVGQKVTCPNCGTKNTVPAEVADSFASPQNGAGPVTLECWSCEERENLAQWSLNGQCVADIT